SFVCILYFPMYIWIRFKTDPLHSWDVHTSADVDSDDERDERDGEDEILIDANQGKENDFIRPRGSVVYLKSQDRSPFDFGHGHHREQVQHYYGYCIFLSSNCNIPTNFTDIGPLLYRVRLMVLVDFVNFMRMTLLSMVSLFLTPIGELEGKDRCNMTRSHHSSSDYCIVGKYVDYTARVQAYGLICLLFSILYFETYTAYTAICLVQVNVDLYPLFFYFLLENLKIATASKLESETDAIWKFQRYQLVVDFTNRLRLPPPLSIFSYLIIVVRWLYRCILCRLCKSRDEADVSVFFDSSKGHRLSEKDYNYWRQLAQDYTKEKMEAENEKQLAKKQMEIIMTITEDVDYQKKVMHQLKSRLKELDRMMNHSHVYLENIKHLTEKIQ
ncbi:protein ced-11, partial [Trichonephila clavata]